MGEFEQEKIGELENKIETYRAWLNEQSKKYSIYINIADAKWKFIEVFGEIPSHLLDANQQTKELK